MYLIKVNRLHTGTTRYYGEGGVWKSRRKNAQRLTAKEVVPLYQDLVACYKPTLQEVVIERVED